MHYLFDHAINMVPLEKDRWAGLVYSWLYRLPMGWFRIWDIYASHTVLKGILHHLGTFETLTSTSNTSQKIWDKLDKPPSGGTLLFPST